MDVTITNLSEVAREAEIRISTEELQPLFDDAYEKYRKKAAIPGFRKGKAPLDMIRRMYGEAIEYDSLDDAADSFYRKAMEEREIQPLGRPTMTDMDFKRGEGFRFTVTYEVRPSIRLKKYTGLLIERPVHTVTESEVDAELEHLRRANATTAEAGSVTDPEHIVTADVQELDEAGMPLIGRRTAGARFLLSDPTLAPEIAGALAAAGTGETYRARFETGEGEKTHTLHVAFMVTGIQKVTLPSFDDEFVRKLTNGKVGTTAEFLQNLRADLERYWSDQAERRVRDAIADEIVRTHEFEVPPSLVENFLDAFIEEIRNRSKDRTLPKGFDEERFRGENRAHAIWQAKWMLLKDAIARQEGIAVTDGELEQIAGAEAARAGVDTGRLLAYFRNSGAARERLLSDKLMAYLRQQAHVQDVQEKEPAGV